jgi:hypothetical protein
MTDQPEVWTDTPDDTPPIDSAYEWGAVKPSTPAPSGGALTDDEREALAEPVYDAYRLGKFGAKEYLPMWHELDRKPMETPEAAAVIAAVERILAARAAQPGTPTAVEALADIFHERIAVARRLDRGRKTNMVDGMNAREANVWDVAERDLRAALAQVEAQTSELRDLSVADHARMAELARVSALSYEEAHHLLHMAAAALRGAGLPGVEALAGEWQAEIEDTAGATVVIDLEDALSQLRAALRDGRTSDAAQAWDDGHRAGCSYFPDCVTLGHHDGNPYRGAALPEPSGGATVTEWGEWAKRAGFTVYPWQRAWFDDTVGAQDRAAALAQVEDQPSEDRLGVSPTQGPPGE